MLKRRIVSLVLALGFLLSTIGPALAMPVDRADSDQLPPGLAKKVFVHYDKDYSQRNLGLQAAASTEPKCALKTPEGNPSPECQSYIDSGIHWNAGTTVKYSVNLNFTARKSPALAKADARQAISDSFQAWQAAMPAVGGLGYEDVGTTTRTPGKADGQNVVGWAKLSKGTIAVTTVWYNPTTKVIVETDMAFNDGYAWAYTAPGCNISDATGCNPVAAGPANTMDLRNIATHEAGHTLMLLDLYDPSNSALTMYGYGSYQERAKDSLGTGDILGADAAY